MSETIPKTMKAIVATQSGDEHNCALQDIPVPTLEDNDILIKVEYAAQNPTDWKHVTNTSVPGVIIGNDVSGTVVQVGSKLVNKDIKLGDKVAATVHGGIYKDQGGFAEYAKASSDLVWKVPEGVSMQDASTVTLAWVTALQKQDYPPKQVDGKPWYLIYGASTSVGLFAVSLAKAIGYRVIGVCSPKNFDLIKSYGAEACVDYKDPSAATKEIQKVTNGDVPLALDAFFSGQPSDEDGQWKVCMDCIQDGGQVNILTLFVPDTFKQYRKGIKVDATMMYTLFGKKFDFNPRGPKSLVLEVNPEDREFHVDLCKRTPDLLTKYGIKPNPVTIRGGLEDVKAGLEYMKQGKVSGEKLVYKVHG